MIHQQRVIIKSDTTLIDKSVELSDIYSQSVTVNYVAATDAIFIGTFLPFNHKYFELSTINTDPTSVTVEVWDGDRYHECVDIIDQTSVSGASFARSENIRFTPNRDKSWTRELDSFEVDGLESTVIYNMYWTKLTFSNDFVAEFKYIGNKFSTDTELYSYYPDLNNSSLKTQYESGKTTWDTQHLMAANAIVSDLIKRRIVFSANQILEPEVFEEAARHKVASIIYGAFGDGYREDKNEALKRYSESMNMNIFNVDSDLDGRLDVKEKVDSVRFMSR
jgi:hypothetical protein